ncbi:MAG: hypothetical protein RMJ43_09530 [Chloroherpetonaceae bacterium]|nr:hypothetical protein [Chloroherpetonaceae bacterium]
MQTASTTLPQPKHVAHVISHVLLLLLTVTIGILLLYLLLKPLFMLCTHYVFPYLPCVVDAGRSLWRTVSQYFYEVILLSQRDFLGALSLGLLRLFVFAAIALFALIIIPMIAICYIFFAYVYTGPFIVLYIFVLLTVCCLTLVSSGIIVEDLMNGCSRSETLRRIREVARAITSTLWGRCRKLYPWPE